MRTLIKSISGWGRYPVQTCELQRPERYEEFIPDAGSVIARGQGRSYGDASLNENSRVLLSERINRFLEFDADQGILRAEAGLTLAEILPVIVPKGWFLPVTPGTKFASLGGCVAADVHGKNHHHDGSFGNHILGIDLILADGTHLDCAPERNQELFWATVGGMGLTGIVGEVELKLVPIQTAHMMVRHYAADNLEQLIGLLQDQEKDDCYTVAWIDCLASGKNLGRGVAMCGHHATLDEVPHDFDNPLVAQTRPIKKIPFGFPAWMLNSRSIGTFNEFYFKREGKKLEPFLTAYDPYFYPLDSIAEWNRMYGKRGFVQYQCVIPDENVYEGMLKLLQALSESRRSSFLAVLKRLGSRGKGLLSFPIPGYTLALDLPVRDDGLLTLLDKLDEIVMQHNGRVYLAKDSRLSGKSFRTMYPRYEEWLKIKHEFDPQNRFSSSLSRRLGITGSAT